MPHAYPYLSVLSYKKKKKEIETAFGKEIDSIEC